MKQIDSKNLSLIPMSTIFVLAPSVLLAAGGAVISDIGDAVNKLAQVVIAIIVGCAVWCGLKLAKGDQDAMPRLVMCIVGVVVVGLAMTLINFFKV